MKNARQFTKCFDYGNQRKFSALSDTTSRKNDERKEKISRAMKHEMFLHKLEEEKIVRL